jgi:hypothetical protein
MTVKELIKHLETLDQDKQIIVIAKDPTDYEYPTSVTTDIINLEEVYIHNYEGDVNNEFKDLQTIYNENTGEEIVPTCYVIRVDA